jgi:hypothetical protein
MYVKEYIEETIICRLCKPTKKDIEVNDNFYELICNTMEPTIKRLSRETVIPGFTNDDLESYFKLKIYQILKRNQFDLDKQPFGLFSVSFKNLLRDIVRMRENGLSRGMHADALDTALQLFFHDGNDFKNVLKVDEDY